jgi:hypothetical protein
MLKKSIIALVAIMLTVSITSSFAPVAKACTEEGTDSAFAMPRC